MKHSLTSPATVAYVMTQKYVDGLPLARQEKIWAREGTCLSRATMANWVIQCSESWLKPLYKHMKQELLTHSVILADETVVQVLKDDGKPATSESRMWLYASAIVCSLVESAKANGIEPFAYLQHVLVQLPYFGKSQSHEELESLMP